MAETKKFCIHSDGLGYCDVLSDDTVRQYCVEGPCPHEKIVEYVPVEEFIAYIDNAFRDRPHGDSFWIDEREHTHTADVGYAFEWWRDIMEPELRRVFGERRADQ